MVQRQSGIESAFRAAPIVTGARHALRNAAMFAAVTALLVVSAATPSFARKRKNPDFGIQDELVVTNSGALLVGTIQTYAAFSNGNVAPIAVIKGAEGSIPAFDVFNVPAEDVLSGVAVNPNGIETEGPAGPVVANSIWVASDLSLLSPGTDAVAGFAPGSTGASDPIAFMITLPAVPSVEYPGNPLSIPEGLAFIPSGSNDLVPGEEAGAAGDFYVTNLTGGTDEAGSVLEYPPDAGSASAINGVAFPYFTIDDNNCTAPQVTDLFGPVGIALDGDNDLWVANSGDGKGAPDSYVIAYAAGANGCPVPIDAVGIGVLQEAEYDAISPVDGSIWVSDLLANAVYQFSALGSVETEIHGKRTRLKSPMGIAMNATGDLYVANNERNQILMFESASTGGLLNVKPFIVVQGRKTGLHQPVGVALAAGVPAFPVPPTATPTGTPSSTPTSTPTETPTATPTSPPT